DLVVACDRGVLPRPWGSDLYGLGHRTCRHEPEAQAGAGDGRGRVEGVAAILEVVRPGEPVDGGIGFDRSPQEGLSGDADAVPRPGARACTASATARVGMNPKPRTVPGTGKVLLKA